MNLLIVDDEFYSVDGIARQIERADLGFAQVFRAYSLVQAQECLLANPVQVMITDIEMPKGSGLELVAWVREAALDVVCVFLTSFANFEYANKAIRLQSFDYLLKPVEESQLLQCMQRAIDRAQQIAAEGERRLAAQRWGTAQTRLMEQFVADLAQGIIPAQHEAIRKELAQRNLPASFADAILSPVLLRYHTRHEDSAWDRGLYEFALKNILTEIFSEDADAPVIARIGDASCVITASGDWPHETLLARCQQAVEVLVHLLPGRFCFYAHMPCPISGLGSATVEMLAAAQNRLDIKNRVEDLAAEQARGHSTLLIPAQRWGELLLERKTTSLRQEADALLDTLLSSDTAGRHDLTRFFHDFMQLIYSALDKSGTSAHRLFDDRMPETPLEKACDSVAHMRAWVAQVLENYQACMSMVGQSASAVEDVCAYIQAHLEEDLTRDRLAAAVYLSPDYLSHVFREKKGTSLTSYIMQQRIRQARTLLLSSGDSIRDIALRCGFANISYFAKQFKRATGKTPQEYRKAP